MSRRNFRITVFTVVMAVLAVLGYIWRGDAPQNPVRIAMPNNGGLVVFEHRRHLEYYKLECRECHHTGAYTKCGNCHGVVLDNAFIQNHRATFSDVADCLVCHHKSKPGAADNLDLFNKGANVDFAAFDISCTDCHGNIKIESLIPNRMSGFHGSCMKCHEKLGKGPHTKTECGQCHTK